MPPMSNVNNGNDPAVRKDSLAVWVGKALKAAKWLEESQNIELEALSGDAGFRRYYRVIGAKSSVLAVDAPPETEKNEAFFHVAQLLRQYGVHAPQIFAMDLQAGFLLVEDLGNELYYPHLINGRQDELYDEAMACLQKIHGIPVQDCGLPLYDEEALQKEMDLFPEWFVQKLLGLEWGDEEQKLFSHVSRTLLDSASKQYQVLVHRDYHCRNLLVGTSASPGVIDFQDAVVGPITYDLVSLLRDCYVCWPEEDVQNWASEYYRCLISAGQIDDYGEEAFLHQFDLMGVQRHIKVLGIFARLYLRDGKSGYLKDLPLVVFYTLSVTKKHPEFKNFVSWFEEKLMPVIKQQDWYKAER